MKKENVIYVSNATGFWYLEIRTTELERSREKNKTKKKRKLVGRAVAV